MKVTKVVQQLLCPENVSCMRCGEERMLDPSTGLCEACGQRLIPFEGGEAQVNGRTLYAPYVYEGEVEGLIQRLKYHGGRYLAKPLGVAMARTIQAQCVQADALVPVPLHASRLRSRGYNQAQLLCEVIANTLAMPLNDQLLVRLRATKPQVSLPASERAQNVKDAFGAMGELKGLTLLLVDDVCTTGATLTACAQALEGQGAQVLLMCAATASS